MKASETKKEENTILCAALNKSAESADEPVNRRLAQCCSGIVILVYSFGTDSFASEVFSTQLPAMSFMKEEDRLRSLSSPTFTTHSANVFEEKRRFQRCCNDFPHPQLIGDVQYTGTDK